MPIRIKIQKHYLRGESTVDLPADVAEVDQQLRATKATGKMVVLYNDGYIQGINIEQNCKMSEAEATDTRSRMGVRDVHL
jgi:hypothetical protein